MNIGIKARWRPEYPFFNAIFVNNFINIVSITLRVKIVFCWMELATCDKYVGNEKFHYTTFNVDNWVRRLELDKKEYFWCQKSSSIMFCDICVKNSQLQSTFCDITNFDHLAHSYFFVFLLETFPLNIFKANLKRTKWAKFGCENKC